MFKSFFERYKKENKKLKKQKNLTQKKTVGG